MERARIFCVAGIDTDIGKTIATGLIARGIAERGVTVITQKGVQTGCDGFSEDIATHRRLMRTPLLAEDRAGLTCQYLFRPPCSPHLAARRAAETIAPETMTAAAERLQKTYEVVLFEGAGGLFVPLTEEVLFIDYLARVRWPVLLVTSSRLGSINHTLAALEGLARRKIALAGVVYNCDPQTDPRIAEDSLAVMGRYLDKYDFSCPIVEMHRAASYQQPGSCRHLASLCGV
ncbi:MAG: dethiobiotin synthase [Desulfopila sp.]